MRGSHGFAIVSALWRATVPVLVVVAGVAVAGQSPRYLQHADVQSLLTELSPIAPIALGRLSLTDRDMAWSAWIIEHDRDIRSRLSKGDEDTIVNWLLLGSSFTSQPPAALDASKLTDADAIRRSASVLGARLDDLIRALRSPGNDERRLFARSFLENLGFNLATVAGADAARARLLDGLQRIILETAQREQELEAARQRGDLGAVSQRFRDRGLSLDTSLVPNYALEQSLTAMKGRRLLRARSVVRVGIIGPGLDFADKNSGFDFYPPQTVQPFAVLDTLRRLQLAPISGNTQIVILDISPRVIDHVGRARAQAGRPGGYTLRLPLDGSIAWVPGFQKYWKAFGSHIGRAVAPPPGPSDPG